MICNALILVDALVVAVVVFYDLTIVAICTAIPSQQLCTSILPTLQL